MTPDEVKRTISEISFTDWAFELSPWALVLRVVFTESDPGSNVVSIQRGRWWRLSPHMTKSEVVQTALKAVLTAVEHEAREKFLYKGKAIYGPHLDVDGLWSVANRLDTR